MDPLKSQLYIIVMMHSHIRLEVLSTYISNIIIDVETKLQRVPAKLFLTDPLIEKYV